jgi:hypothetical protein
MAAQQEGEETFEGASRNGFRSATEAAVAVFEERHGPPPEPVALSVVEMYVTVQNPLGDYRVVLKRRD